MRRSNASRRRTGSSGSKIGRASSGAKTYPVAMGARCDDERFFVTLDDGRVLSAPLTTRLRHATPQARRNCRVNDFGTNLHWDDADEDIGVNYVLGVREDKYEASIFKGPTNM